MEKTLEIKKFSLKNYKTLLPKELQKLALKNPVRECDESPKNNFVAYVDDGADSYDVSLVFSVKSELEMHGCDCKSTIDFCRHKAALLIHIAEGKKTATAAVKARAKSKVSVSNALLDEVDTLELKLWVKDLFAKNKDLELAFVNKFSNTTRVFTVKEAQKISADAVNAVVKNKKNLDPTELKKITALWAVVHEPIAEHYCANVTDENAFAVFHAVLRFCNDFNEKINVNSNKVNKYTDTMLLQTIEPVAILQLDEAWLKSCKYFISKLLEKPYAVNAFYLHHLQAVMAVASPERSAALIALLAENYKSIPDERLHIYSSYTRFFFELVKTHDLQPSYCEVFPPIRYLNAYNTELIQMLMSYGKYDRAEKFCKAQIAGNFNDAYNVPYLLILKEIYTLKLNEAGLLKTIEALFPFTFHFSDFEYIYENMSDEEEKKKWRTKMLSKARNTYDRSVVEVNDFPFHLMNMEGKYKKMIDYIDDYTQFSIINEYFEPMANADRLGLIKKILKKTEGSLWQPSSENNKREEASFLPLADKMIKLYGADFLRKIIQEKKSGFGFYSVNSFIQYLKKIIATE